MERFATFLLNPWQGLDGSGQPTAKAPQQQRTSARSDASKENYEPQTKPVQRSDQPGVVSEAQVFERTFPANSASSKRSVMQHGGDDRIHDIPGRQVNSSEAIADGKAELGRATWTLLHTLAAQYPDCPTRRQRKDTDRLVRFEKLPFMTSPNTCSGRFS